MTDESDAGGLNHPDEREVQAAAAWAHRVVLTAGYGLGLAWLALLAWVFLG